MLATEHPFLSLPLFDTDIEPGAFCKIYLELGPHGYPGYAGIFQKQKQYCGTILGDR
jgi:hypothetical protein